MKRIQTHIYSKKHRSGNITWVVRYKDFQGKWVVFSAGKSKDEALIYEAKIRQQLFAGVDPRESKKTVENDATISEAIDYYYSHPRFKIRKQRCQKEIRSFMESMIRPRWGKLNISRLTSDHFFKFYEERIAEDLSKNTIRRNHYVLCAFFGAYCSGHKGVKNPMSDLPKLKTIAPKQAPSRAINFLTPEELKLLFQETNKSRSELMHSFVKFLAYTGMRRSEALDLRWADVDVAQEFFHVRDSKTEGSTRSIPIEAEAWQAIKELRGNGEFVFSYPNGERPFRDSFLKPLKLAVKKTGFTKRIDLHTLRHSYGSNKLRAGWGLKKVSLLLGHSDIQITAKIYAHMLDGDLKVADQTSALKQEAMLGQLMKVISGLSVTAPNEGSGSEMPEMHIQEELPLVAPPVLRDYNDGVSTLKKKRGTN